MCEKLRIAEAELCEVTEIVTKMRETMSAYVGTFTRFVHKLQRQVDSLQAQKSEGAGVEIQCYEENSVADGRFDEHEGWDGKIFGNPGSCERSGRTAHGGRRPAAPAFFFFSEDAIAGSGHSACRSPAAALFAQARVSN